MEDQKNKKTINQKPKVFVALSGGVDSSVSTALLKNDGYEVTGVFIKVWHPDFLPCDWKKEREDAMRVCADLDIPFLMFDFEKEYKEEIVDYMISEYKLGRTPNPDVMCNKNIKFGAFLEKAKKMGADMIATGHYSRRSQTSKYKLLEGKDKNKDQSYFLWTLNQKQLSKTLFPIGNLEKNEVRKLAKKHELDTAEKKDSQGLCFVGKVNMRDFLKNFIQEKRGNVLNEKGEIIGIHDGATFYTIGQRHGFTITKKTPNEKKYFIVSKDAKENTIIVSNKTEKDSPIFNAKEVELENINWISGETPDLDKKYLSRIRYRQDKQGCKIETKNNKIFIKFDEPQKAVALGQSVVIYDDEECLGGGIVRKIKK